MSCSTCQGQSRSTMKPGNVRADFRLSVLWRYHARRRDHAASAVYPSTAMSCRRLFSRHTLASASGSRCREQPVVAQRHIANIRCRWHLRSRPQSLLSVSISASPPVRCSNHRPSQKHPLGSNPHRPKAYPNRSSVPRFVPGGFIQRLPADAFASCILTTWRADVKQT